MEDESRNTLPEDNNVQEEEQEAGQEETHQNLHYDDFSRPVPFVYRI